MSIATETKTQSIENAVLENTAFKGPFKWHLRRRNWIEVDAVLSAVAVLLALAPDPSFTLAWVSPDPFVPGVVQAALIYPWFVILCMHVTGLQDPLDDRRGWVALVRVIIAVAVAIGLCLLARYFVSLQPVGRTFMIRTLVLSVAFLWGARAILWNLSSAAPKRIGCYLSGPGFERLTALIGSNQLPVELITAEQNQDHALSADAAAFFIQQGVDEVVVAARDGRRDLWIACLNRGLQVTEVAVFVEREYYKVSCADIDLSWFITINLKWNHPFYNRIKRLIDLLVSIVGLLLSAPILMMAALAIFIESGRPVFYSQTRVGLRSKPYRLWKLRTMGTDAERAGAQWAMKGDPRITKVGHVLRRTRIDELPQFWNVFKGEMSMIGPRPERPEFVEKLGALIPIYPQRHWIKPGITGWAQINYPYGASTEDAFEKLCFDLYYMKNASLLLDLHIALRTVGTVMKGSR